MKSSCCTLLFLLLFSPLGVLFAGNPELSGKDSHLREIPAPSTIVKFIENQNQWDSPIRYMAEIAQGRLYLENNRFTWSFCDMEDFHDRFFHGRGGEDIQVLDCHAFRTEFLGANQNPKLTPSGKYPEYRNYFIGNDPSKWAGEVGLFHDVTYEALYPGIDLQIYGLDKGVKYDFIVQPGIDPNLIRIKYDGLNEIKIENGDLHLVTSINEIVEQRPFAYQDFAGVREEVPCLFKLDGNLLTFEFPEGYNTNYDLVIDPTLIFGSYTGSTTDNFGYTATYDTAGNLYGGGVAFGQAYPISVGVYQSTFGGGGSGGLFGPIDISISKFNSNGTALVYSTFLGGSNNEQPHSMIVTEAGELMVYGRTYSTDFPVSASAYDQTANGAADLCITKFNVAGSGIIGSTYIGGTADDAVNITSTFGQSSLKYNYGDDARGEIMIDAQNNIYVASCTQSINFPTSGSAPQVSNGGMQDGVVCKFNSNLSALTWSTFLGGNGNDAAYSIKLDASNNPYVSGGTASNNFITTTGALQTTYGGAIDGYVTQLNAAGTAIMNSTYIGTNAYDQSYFLEIDVNGDIYIVGQTLGNFPVSPGVYSNNGGTQFIQKLNPALSNSFFSTRFGSGSAQINISPTAFLVDVCGFIYVSGWGGSTNHTGTGNTIGMPITAATAHQTTTDGSDIYLIVLAKDAAALEYATFFGGSTSQEHVDGGTSRFNKELEVYQAVCAGCGGNSDFPTTTGAVSNLNGSTNCNLGVFKFKFDPQTVEAKFSTQILSGCTPFPVTFTNGSSGGHSYIWDFGDGTSDTAANPTHVYTIPDTYFVQLLVVDTNSCNGIDSVTKTVIVFSKPLASVSNDTATCNGAKVQLLATGGTSYLWKPSAGLSNDTIPNPMASPTQTTTYTVIVSTGGGCLDSNTITVTVSTFTAEAGLDVDFCFGTGGTELLGTAYGGGVQPFYYEWWCDSTNTWCGIDSVFDDDPNVNPTVSAMYYLRVTDWNGCQSTVDSVFVKVKPHPIADAGPDKFICHAPAAGTLINASVANSAQVPGPYTYQWLSGNGLNDSTILNPFARPDTTTIYTLLITSSSNGCTSHPTTVDTLSSVTVHVKPLPVADAGPDIDQCLNDQIILHGVGTEAGPLYSYEWSPSTGLSSPSVPNPVASPIITTEYILTVWSNGCPSYGDTMRLNVHTLPTVDAGPDVEICLGQNGQLDGEAWGDPTATGYGYFWWPNTGILSSNTDENPLVGPDSTTVYYLFATSSWGCVSPPDSTTLHLKPSPFSEAGPNQFLCHGDSIKLLGSVYYTSTNPVTGPGQIFYTWAPSNTLSDPNIAQPMAGPTNTTVYTLTVQYNTCIHSDDVVISVSPEIGAGVSADTNVFCQYDTVQLTAWGGLGNADFTWIPALGLSDPNSAIPMAFPDQSTNYTLLVSEGGCTDSLNLNLLVIPQPEVAYVNSQEEGCAPFVVNFLETSRNAISWVWDFGDGTEVINEQNPSHTYSQPGIYPVKLTAIGPGACMNDVTDAIIIVGEGPKADFRSDPEAPQELVLPNPGIQFWNESEGGNRYLWEFGDGNVSASDNPVHHYPQAGEYWVLLRAFSAEGCVSEIKKGPYTIINPDILIPNVFSPNGDDKNDGFLAKYNGTQPFVMKIFDRWGVLHFETNNKNESWDGHGKDGQILPEGVYFYTLAIGNKDFTGNITMLR